MTHNERALELYKEGKNYSQAAKQVAKEYNLTYTDNFRRVVTKWMKRRIDKGVFDECEKVGIDAEKINFKLAYNNEISNCFNVDYRML